MFIIAEANTLQFPLYLIVENFSEKWLLEKSSDLLVANYKILPRKKFSLPQGIISNRLGQKVKSSSQSFSPKIAKLFPEYECKNSPQGRF